MSTKDERNYEILNTIATGGTAVLYKAIQTSLERPVVVKRLHSHLTSDPNFTRRFEIEAKAAASLDHENIVRIIDFGSSNNNYFIVMEFIDGKSLKELLAERGHFSEELTLLIAHEICMGLDHAHQRGIIHRDIKPANIMITKDGHVKITDFGLAKLHENQTQQTVANTLLGTPLYMSPEQAIGDTIDNRSDIFSLGTICYEMITGTQPFKGDNYASVIQHIINGHVPSPSKLRKDISDRAEMIIMKALSKEPSKRYRTALEMARDIEAYLGQEKILSVKDRLKRIMQGEKDVEEDRSSASEIKKPSYFKRVSSIIGFSAAAVVAILVVLYPSRLEYAESRIKALLKPNPSAPGKLPQNQIHASAGINAFGSTDLNPIRSDNMIPIEVSVEQVTSKVDTISLSMENTETNSDEGKDTLGTITPPAETPVKESTEPETSNKKSPAIAKGLIEITVDPTASIIIDGVERTFSSSLGPLELSRGPHELICRRDGYEEYRETIKIKKGELSRRNITLQKIMGQLVLNTQKGARVFIDGEYRGTTPLHGPIRLPAGKHEVEIKKAGFKTWSSIVFVPESEELVLNIALVPM